MKDDMDYESLGLSSGAAHARFLGENEDDDPLCCFGSSCASAALCSPTCVSAAHAWLVHQWGTVEITLAFGP